MKKFAKARAFIEKNKKTLMIAVGILATGTLAIIGYNVLEQSDSEPHTSQWLKDLSDDELPEEHEKARLACEKITEKNPGWIVR